MRRRSLLLLVLSFLLLSGCGTKDGGTDSSGSENVSNQVNTSTKSTDTDTQDKTNIGSDNDRTTPITRYGITLSDVVITDAYGSMSEMLGASEGEADIADAAYYPIGMLGLWRNTGDYEGWGYQDFWTYLVPPDATVTFHLTDEISRYWLTSYDLETVEDGWGGSWNATYMDTYESDELNPGDYTLTRAEIQELIPGADLILCGMGDDYIEILFDDGSIITVPEASSNADPGQGSAPNLSLGTEAVYTGMESEIESVQIALGNDLSGEHHYMSAEIYHLPANGTFTLQILEGKNYCSISGYTLQKAEAGKWDTVPCGGYFYREKLEQGDYTLTLEEIQKDIPEFDLLVCDNGDKFFLVVFDEG